MATTSIAASLKDQRKRNLATANLNDLAALRAAFVALTAKLDADNGITDVNYASTLDPAVLETVV